MAYGQILPSYIEAGLVVGYHCPACGRNDGWFHLHFPILTLTNNGNCDRIVYPIECPCGRHGRVSTVLPILLYGYLLARVQLLESRKSKKQPKSIKPEQSELLNKFIKDFETAMGDYDSVRSVIENNRPAEPWKDKSSQQNDPSELDRLQFGYDESSWQSFLKRLGLDQDDQEESNK